MFQSILSSIIFCHGRNWHIQTENGTISMKTLSQNFTIIVFIKCRKEIIQSRTVSFLKLIWHVLANMPFSRKELNKIKMSHQVIAHGLNVDHFTRPKQGTITLCFDALYAHILQASGRAEKLIRYIPILCPQWLEMYC